MLQKTLVPPSFQSIKSLPVDYRFMGSPASDRNEKSNGVNLNIGDVIGSSSLKNSQTGNEVVETVDNEDSPYNGNNVLVEDRPSTGDEDLDSMALPMPSFSASRSDCRWGDTTSYAAKKVFCGLFFIKICSLCS